MGPLRLTPTYAIATGIVTTTDLGNSQDIGYQGMKWRARPRGRGQAEIACGRGRCPRVADSAVKPMIDEFMGIAVKVKMCDHADDSMVIQRRDGDRKFPALDVDAATVRDQRELEYHTMDGETAIIKGEVIVGCQFRNIEREDARTYSGTDEANWEGCATLEGVIGHYTTVRSRL